MIFKSRRNLDLFLNVRQDREKIRSSSSSWVCVKGVTPKKIYSKAEKAEEYKNQTYNVTPSSTKVNDSLSVTDVTL